MSQPNSTGQELGAQTSQQGTNAAPQRAGTATSSSATDQSSNATSNNNPAHGSSEQPTTMQEPAPQTQQQITSAAPQQAENAASSATDQSSNATGNGSAAQDSSGEVDLGEDEDDYAAEYVQLDPVSSLYYYAVPGPPVKESASEEDRDRRMLEVHSAINLLIERDMITYRIGECPEEDLMDTGDALIEQTKRDWRLEALRTQKRKVTLAYGLPGDLNTLSANELDAKMDQIEQMEDDLKIDECGRARPVDMSDSQWSDRKRALVETAKNRPQEDDEHEDVPHAEYANPPGAAFQAAEAMETSIESLPQEPPPEIRELHRLMASLIMNWWNVGASGNDHSSIASYNARIGSLQGDGKYKLASTLIELWQTNLKVILRECETEPTPEKVGNLIGTAITYTNHLRRSYLDWKMVVTKDIHRRIFMTVHRASVSQDVQRQIRALEDSWLAIRPQQHSYFLATIPVIAGFMYIEDDSGRTRLNPDHMDLCTKQFQHLNNRLGNRNLEMALPSRDHKIPMHELEVIVKHQAAMRWTEAEAEVIKFLYKTDLLGIPGFDQVKTALDYQGKAQHIDKELARQEVMEVELPPSLSQNLGDIPIDNISSRSSLAYPTAEVKTVAWGDHCGKFYLNQYGPSDAPIWRKERFACAEWERTYAKLEPPLCFKVSDPTNRMGEIKRGSAHRYGAAHFRGIHGVAFDHGDDNNPLININPDAHSRSEGEKFSSTYVIICWDRDLDNKAPIPCWETRTTARRVGRSKKDVDRKIYAKAMEMQVKFDELHKAGGSPDVPSPPRNVQTTRNQPHIAPTAHSQTRSTTAVPNMWGFRFRSLEVKTRDGT